MAVAFDAKSASITAATSAFSNGTPTFTGLLTVGVGATFLIIGISVEAATGSTTGVSWNSVAMTQIGTTISLTGTNSNAIISLWGLVNPASGSNTLGVTCSGLPGSSSGYYFGISFTGTSTASVAAATKGFNTNTATSTSLSVTSGVSLSASEMAVAFGIATGNGYNNSTTETMGGTQIGENQSLADNACAAYFTGTGSTTTASATLSAPSQPWGAMIVGLTTPAAATNPFLNNTDLPPRGYVYHEWQTWLDLGLATLPKQSITKPFAQTSWPVPPPVTWFRDWQEQGNAQIPFRNFTKPFKQTEWPNPYPVQWYQSWTQVGTLPTSSTTKPFNKSDWPNPQPVTWYQSWIKSLQPTPSTQKPFNQSDYPNPYPVTWYRSIEGIGNALRAITQNPFFQTNWPLPQPVTWYRSWEEPGNSVLPQPSATFPFVQTDYPNPPRVIWDRFWSQSPAQPLVTNPFFQLDWPNPPRTVWYQSLTIPGNTLLPVGNPFFQNVDAPLPTVPQPIDQTWIQNLAEFYQANTFPFSQTDWENPPPVYWFRDYNQNLVLYLPVGQKPFSQTDWPLTKAPQPIDQFYSQALALNLPIPPPPPQVLFGGHQWTEADVKRSAAQWLNLVRWNGGSTASFFKR
jgi:hypothetical protein